ncbi:MAG: hypothetical protein JJT76_09160 [Clostridiaceae bacterium]|nr:hypothetical protein [Clostridiaceae bacterium]
MVTECGLNFEKTQQVIMVSRNVPVVLITYDSEDVEVLVTKVADYN